MTRKPRLGFSSGGGYGGKAARTLHGPKMKCDTSHFGSFPRCFDEIWSSVTCHATSVVTSQSRSVNGFFHTRDGCDIFYLVCMCIFCDCYRFFLKPPTVSICVLATHPEWVWHLLPSLYVYFLRARGQRSRFFSKSSSASMNHHKTEQNWYSTGCSTPEAAVGLN